MKIRIGDRVRTRHNRVWATVVGTDFIWSKRLFIIRTDFEYTTYCSSQYIEKLPRYRGYAEASDTTKAIKHLQHYLKNMRLNVNDITEEE